MAQLDQRTALPDQCLHSAEADVRPPRRKSGFDPKRAYSAYIGGCRIASFSGKINERSFFRQRGLAHAVHDALALLQENGIVALSAETKTANGEHGLKRQPGLGFGPRLHQLAE